jgi:hypothetical protein
MVVPTLLYGTEIWVKEKNNKVAEEEMGFLTTVSGCTRFNNI